MGDQVYCEGRMVKTPVPPGPRVSGPDRVVAAQKPEGWALLRATMKWGVTGWSVRLWTDTVTESMPWVRLEVWNLTTANFRGAELKATTATTTAAARGTPTAARCIQCRAVVGPTARVVDPARVAAATTAAG